MSKPSSEQKLVAFFITLMALPFAVASFGWAMQYSWNAVLVNFLPLREVAFFEACAIGAAVRFMASGGRTSIRPDEDDDFGPIGNAFLRIFVSVFGPLVFMAALFFYIQMAGL